MCIYMYVYIYICINICVCLRIYITRLDWFFLLKNSRTYSFCTLNKSVKICYYRSVCAAMINLDCFRYSGKNDEKGNKNLL